MPFDKSTWIVSLFALIALFVFACSSFANSIRTVALSGDQVPGASNGLLFERFEKVVINSSGDTTFGGAMRVGSGDVTSINQHAIFQENISGIQALVRSGDQAPETGSSSVIFRESFDMFSPFQSFSVNDAGDLALRARISGSGISSGQVNDIGIWSTTGGNLGLVARIGNKPPGTANDIVRFNELGTPSISDTGQVSFEAQVLRNSRSESSIWSEDSGTLASVALQGERAAGGPSDGRLLDGLRALPSRTGLSGVISRFDLSGIGRIENGSPRIIAYDGISAAEIEDGATLSVGEPGTISTNNKGHFVFAGAIRPNGASSPEPSVLLWENELLSLVARSGTHAPGTPAEAEFRFFSSTEISSSGHVAFFAGLLQGLGGVDSSNSFGAWSNGSGELKLVARQGSQAPGTPAGTRFNAPNIAALNANGQIVLIGSLDREVAGVTRENDAGIWAEDLEGTLKLIVREGDELEVRPGDFRTISEFNFSSSFEDDGGIQGFNDLGQIAFSASFTDGTSGVFVSELVAVPEPGILAYVLWGILLLPNRGRCLTFV